MSSAKKQSIILVYLHMFSCRLTVRKRSPYGMQRDDKVLKLLSADPCSSHLYLITNVSEPYQLPDILLASVCGRKCVYTGELISRCSCDICVYC